MCDCAIVQHTRGLYRAVGKLNSLADSDSANDCYGYAEDEAGKGIN
jgi:hypothetical protein